jgi:hypothetical protein
MDIGFPGLLPPGSIFVHVHPFSEGESSCGSFYDPGPSPADWTSLQTWGIDQGIILDEDSITVYKKGPSDEEIVNSEDSCL